MSADAWEQARTLRHALAESIELGRRTAMRAYAAGLIVGTLIGYLLARGLAR
jgi:hypothetical protein